MVDGLVILPPLRDSPMQIVQKDLVPPFVHQMLKFIPLDMIFKMRNKQVCLVSFAQFEQIDLREVKNNLLIFLRFSLKL